MDYNAASLNESRRMCSQLDGKRNDSPNILWSASCHTGFPAAEISRDFAGPPGARVKAGVGGFRLRTRSVCELCDAALCQSPNQNIIDIVTTTYYAVVMTPRRVTTFRIEEELINGMQAVWERDGVQVSEQVRRAISAYLESKGINLRADKKQEGKRATRKRRKKRS